MENIITGSETNMGPILHRTADLIKKKGLIIFISDLFDDPDEIISGLKHFRYKGHEIIVFHILDPQELNLNFSKRTRFIDMESKEHITTEPWHFKTDYKKSVQSFCNYYKTNCLKNKIDYILINTETKLDIALSDYLLKRKRMQ